LDLDKKNVQAAVLGLIVGTGVGIIVFGIGILVIVNIFPG
jgi:hypothetical protein